MARGTLVSELRSVPDDPEALLDWIELQGWGDGLPVLPPTEERVQAMLEATPLAAGARRRRGGAATRRGHRREDRRQRGPRRLPPEAFPAVLAAVAGGVRSALQPLRRQQHHLLRHAGPHDQRPGPSDAGHRVRLLVSRPQRPCQRHHRTGAAPGDAQRRRLGARRRLQVDVRSAGPRLAVLRRVGGDAAPGSRSTSAAAFAPSRA